MRKTLIISAIALTCVMAYGINAQSATTIDTPKPATAKAPPSPLMGHLLRPSAQWLEDYSDKPIKEVAMFYTMRRLIDTANRQQQELETLKVANKELKIELDALKALVHGIQTAGDDPNGP